MNKTMDKLPDSIRNIAVAGMLGAGILSSTVACDYNGDEVRNETEMMLIYEQHGGEKFKDDLFIKAGVNVRSQPEIVNLDSDASGQENIAHTLEEDIVMQFPDIIVNRNGERFVKITNEGYRINSDSPANEYNYISLSLLGQRDEAGDPLMERVPVSDEERQARIDRTEINVKGPEPKTTLPDGWN